VIGTRSRGTALLRAAAALALALTLAPVLALGGCGSTGPVGQSVYRIFSVDKKLADPVLVIRAPSGDELGVGTQYGPIFLGRHARAGEIEVVAWFGDGPSIESSVVEPLGGGLFTATTEIRLPQVPIRFTLPEAGETVIVMGRRGEERWQEKVRVASHPKLRGLLLEYVDGRLTSDEAIGAGVYVYGPRGVDDPQLLGLISGRVEIQEGAGTHRYLVAMGPEDLWRLVAWRRDWTPKPRWVYREDVM
jgi:hypothetical protein